MTESDPHGTSAPQWHAHSSGPLVGARGSSLDSERFRSVHRTRRLFCGRLSVRQTDCGREAVFDMRRRAFISLLGGAVVWSLAARAQQTDPTHLIGFLPGGASERDAEWHPI